MLSCEWFSRKSFTRNLLCQMQCHQLHRLERDEEPCPVHLCAHFLPFFSTCEKWPWRNKHIHPGSLFMRYEQPFHQNHESLYFATLDSVKAFDVVHHTNLLDKLTDKGVYDGPNGSLFISILLHNSEFGIPKFALRISEFWIRNCEVFVIRANGNR